jgi:hypothetical protein
MPTMTVKEWAAEYKLINAAEREDLTTSGTGRRECAFVLSVQIGDRPLRFSRRA